jgi:transposase
MNGKYVVRLDKDEREMLQRLVSVGKGAARRLTHARVLLQADESRDGPGWTDTRIAEALGVGVRTVETIRQRFVEEGLELALERKKRLTPPVEPLLDGEKEAQLIAVCCSKAPQGRERWTLRLLADRMVELEVVESVSHETVRRVLKKTS